MSNESKVKVYDRPGPVARLRSTTWVPIMLLVLLVVSGLSIAYFTVWQP